MKRDIFESVIDVGSGFILAILIQLLIFPLFGLYPTILDSVGIALIFTVVSMIRSAIWRWWFRRNDVRIERLFKSYK
jgi:predicted signal transduction protein with EAL and GGDEF domain